MRIDNAEFAARGESVSGDAALCDMPRLTAALRDAGGANGGDERPAAAAAAIHYRIRGGESGRCLWLEVELRGGLPLVCCRCGAGFDFAVDGARRFVIVGREGEAAVGEEEIARDPAMDLDAFVEDELIMAVPIAPRHAECPN